MSIFGAVAGIVGGILGNRAEQRAVDEANQQSWDQMRWQNSYNRGSATKAYKRGRKNMLLADRLNDRNTRQAESFQAREALKSRQATEKSALRNRRWAKQDYRQQKDDMASQFVRLRRAAKKGGFNPLTALGQPMIPGPAGGLSSSSYAAASGVGASQVQAAGASAAMGGYGAPVAVPSLSSNDAILGGVQELGRELTGEAAQERANAQLAQDIMKVELERARSGFDRSQVPVVPTFQGGGLGVSTAMAGPARIAEPSPLSPGAPVAQHLWGPSPTDNFASNSAQQQSNRLNWPTKLKEEDVTTGFRTVIRDGKTYRVPDMDMDEYILQEAHIAAQNYRYQYQDFKREAASAYESARSVIEDNTRTFSNYLGTLGRSGQEADYNFDFYQGRLPNY